MTISERIPPLYSIYYYTDFLYKVVKFNRKSVSLALHDPKEDPEGRFASSYSRSRSMVLQYALCNQWDYFITITLDPNLHDRYEHLDSVYKTIYSFFKFYRSTFSPSFRFLLVPEYHQDRAWHFHGLVRGVLPRHLSKFVPGLHPWKLIDAHYLNWGMLACVSGFVSLSELKNSVGAAFYITKYITKEHANDGFYDHLYYHSRGLSTARPVADCYAYCESLDKCLTFEAPFCSTGWVSFSSPDFVFPLDIPGCEPREFENIFPSDDIGLEVVSPADPDGFQPLQLTFEDWIKSQSLVLFNP